MENWKDYIGKKVEVSEGNDWLQRILLYVYEDGKVACVDEELFLQQRSGIIMIWKQWRPIPEKTKRPITNKELIEAGANWVFNPSGDRFNILQSTNNSSGIYFLYRGAILLKYIHELIEHKYTWSSSTEPNVRRSFEVEE